MSPIRYVKEFFAKVSFFLLYEKARSESFVSEHLAKLSWKNLSVSLYPFPHVIIDNFYNPESYKELESVIKGRLAKGFSHDVEKERFFPFSKVYGDVVNEGYICTPYYGESRITDLFLSKSWIDFFGTVFSRKLEYATSLAFHHHLPNDRTWRAHTDDETLMFEEKTRLPSGVMSHSPFGDNHITLTRQLAILVYVGNDDYAPGKGGGTAMYRVPEFHIPAKVVEPVNNRMLLFPVHPTSYHGFQSNAFPRSTLAQWFYSK